MSPSSAALSTSRSGQTSNGASRPNASLIGTASPNSSSGRAAASFDAAETAAERSLRQIPRFFLRKPAAVQGGQAQLVQQEACARLREYMSSLVLDPSELDECWHLLKAHVSPPYSPADERINYDDFCQVADQLQLRQVAGGSAERFFACS